MTNLMTSTLLLLIGANYFLVIFLDLRSLINYFFIFSKISTFYSCNSISITPSREGKQIYVLSTLMHSMRLIIQLGRLSDD